MEAFADVSLYKMFAKSSIICMNSSYLSHLFIAYPFHYMPNIQFARILHVLPTPATYQSNQHVCFVWIQPLLLPCIHTAICTPPDQLHAVPRAQ